MGAVQEDSRQLEATGYTELALETPKTNLNLSVADNLKSVNRGLSSQEQGHLPLLTAVDGGAVFAGYEPLSPDETTYSYNRFLDEVVPHRTLGCIRLIGFMMYHTTRRSNWQLVASMSQIAKTIRLTDRTAYNAVKEAERHGYITCLREPQRSARHTPALPGVWILNITDDDTDLTRGFYNGDKFRTPLPNRLLLETIMAEDLVVVKYLCAVARLTIGFAESDGRRRLRIERGTNKLREEAGIGNKNDFLRARRIAREKNYATFTSDRDGGRASYGLAWSRDWDGDRRKLRTRDVEDPGKNRTSQQRPRKETYHDHGKDRTGASEEIVPVSPGQLGTNRTTRNVPQSKQASQTRIQQQATPDVVGALVSFGIAGPVAQQLAASYPVEKILFQLECYPLRLEQRDWRNPAGMLRDSVEKDWAPPPQFESKRKEIQKRIRLQEEQAREQHRARFQQEWDRYVDETAAVIEREDPEAFYIFAEAEVEGREEIRNMAISKANRKFLEKNLERFESPTLRRKRMVDHFGGRILDFWEWDRTCNPERMCR